MYVAPICAYQRPPCLYEEALQQVMNENVPPLATDEDLSIKSLENLVKKFKQIATIGNNTSYASIIEM